MVKKTTSKKNLDKSNKKDNKNKKWVPPTLRKNNFSTPEEARELNKKYKEGLQKLNEMAITLGGKEKAKNNPEYIRFREENKGIMRQYYDILEKYQVNKDSKPEDKKEDKKENKKEEKKEEKKEDNNNKEINSDFLTEKDIKKIITELRVSIKSAENKNDVNEAVFLKAKLRRFIDRIESIRNGGESKNEYEGSNIKI